MKNIIEYLAFLTPIVRIVHFAIYVYLDRLAGTPTPVLWLALDVLAIGLLTAYGMYKGYAVFVIPFVLALAMWSFFTLASVGPYPITPLIVILLLLQIKHKIVKQKLECAR